MRISLNTSSTQPGTVGLLRAHATNHVVRFAIRLQGEADVPSFSDQVLRADQAYYWSPEWQQREYLADLDTLVGDVYKPADLDDLLEWLHQD